MTTQELVELSEKISDLQNQICEGYLKRFKELYDIAQEKDMTEFGPTEEEIENCEYDLKIPFTAYDAGDVFIGDILAFKLEDGELCVTMADHDRLSDWEIEDDLYITYDVYTKENFMFAPYILEFLESKLL